MIWPFGRKADPAPEKRASGFTAEVISAREAYVSGARGIAELTGTVQACVSLWENGLTLADVTGAPQLDPPTLACIARSLALRGEFVGLIRGDRIIPTIDHDVRTRDGVPTAYRVSVPEAGGGRSETALAAEILHFRIGADPAQPWIGQAPLRRSSLTAGLLHTLEAALREVYESAPLGTQILHLPKGTSDDVKAMQRTFLGKRGSTLIVEGVAQATAAGLHPTVGQKPDDLTPGLDRAMPIAALEAARASVSQAFGVLPAMHNPSTTGPLIREAQRHLAQWTLSPICALIAAEASIKLAGEVTLDPMRPLQAYDAGGRARAMAGIVQALSQAKDAGIAPDTALQLVGWEGAQR
ncbi:MAG: hypothetical protein AAF968_11115 [Pseudomonadota bacterium]